MKRDEYLRVCVRAAKAVVDDVVTAANPIWLTSLTGMTFEDFSDFMEDSHLNSALDPQHRHVHQDMTQPLCNYYSASSHNTYLTGKHIEICYTLT